MLIITSFTFYSGIKISNYLVKGLPEKVKKTKKTSLIILAGILIIYKVVGYFVKLDMSINTNSVFIEYIAIPIGLSFYIFQSYSYISDISKEKYSAEKDLSKFLLYTAFFAKFTSGPIERNNIFRQNIENAKIKKYPDIQNISYSIMCIVVGMFFKINISARLEVFVNTIWDNLENQSYIWLIIGALLYSIQIYSDFAGYTYLAIGTARLYGINLTWNFMAPYMESGISEFWRKWHISLSSFLKDYVYIPLGGNRYGNIRKCINTIIVFIICGIWHGNGFQFIIWGLLHGIFSIIEIIFKPKVKLLFSGLLGCIITFIEVTFAWIFFRADSLTNAFKYIGKMFRVQKIDAFIFINNAEAIGLNETELIVTILLLVILFIHDLIIKSTNKQFIDVVVRKNIVFKSIIIYILVIVTIIFGIYGPGLQMNDFIYMQF